MFRPRPNAAGGSSKDTGPSVTPDTTGNPAPTDGVVKDTQASLPTGTGEESFISKMMADK